MLAAAAMVPSVAVASQLYFGYRMRGVRMPFAAALATQLFHWELWAVAGPFVWDLERRWPIGPARRWHALLRHLAAAFVVAAAVLAAYLALYHALIRLPIPPSWFAGFDRSLAGTAVFFVTAYFHLELIVYAAIVAVAHASRATALLRAREHEALRLGEEIEYLRRYLTIEEARFADRLRIDWDINPAAMDAPVPAFILQPLVENAFRHGISRRVENSTLSIAATLEEGALRITIDNDGPPLPPDVAARFAAGQDEPLSATGGLGLRLCREICHALGSRLEAGITADGATEFRFTLPAAPVPSA